MKNWTRIFFICLVFVGGALLFGYWSTGQFDKIFADLDSSLLANGNFAYESIVNNRTNASPESKAQDDSLDSAELESLPTSEFSLTFPSEGNTKIYVGCTYPISWESSVTVSSLEVALVGAYTKESLGPIASGLKKKNNIEKDSMSLDWKVGEVWPGEYFILISKINDIDIEEKIESKYFIIEKIPEDTSEEEQKDICGQIDSEELEQA